ncbi:MAG: TatD family hydrolase [Gemmatimonadota bacterium]
MPGAPGFFDSHSHLQDPAFDGDREEVLARAWHAGVREIAVIASDPDSAASARALAAREPAAASPRLYWTAGLHPHDAVRWDKDVREAILEHLDAGALAVGETGLDFHYDSSPRDRQRDAFAGQLAIARERDLPVVVHSRDAEDDTLEVIADSELPPERVVLHCFSGSLAMLERAAEAGHYVSFSGMVTFRSFAAGTLVGRVSADRLLAETDAPYLAPVPHRGTRNEPAFVVETIARLAELKGTDVTAMGALTRANARRFYGLPDEDDPEA